MLHDIGDEASPGAPWNVVWSETPAVSDCTVLAVSSLCALCAGSCLRWGLRWVSWFWDKLAQLNHIHTLSLDMWYIQTWIQDHLFKTEIETQGSQGRGWDQDSRSGVSRPKPWPRLWRLGLESKTQVSKTQGLDICFSSFFGCLWHQLGF